MARIYLLCYGFIILVTQFVAGKSYDPKYDFLQPNKITEKPKLANPQNDDQIKRRMLSYFDHQVEVKSSKMHSHSDIIQIIRNGDQYVYQYEIEVKQTTHPYLFMLLQLIKLKSQVPIQLITEKILKLFIAFKKFNLMSVSVIDNKLLLQILYFIFPELDSKVLFQLAQQPIDLNLLKNLFKLIFSHYPSYKIDEIFDGASTLGETMVRFSLHFCPDLKQHFLWNENYPIEEKLKVIIKLLFPGLPDLIITNLINPSKPLKQRIWMFLEALYNGQLLPPQDHEIQMSGSEWDKFINLLKMQHIPTNSIPPEIFWFLYASRNSPELPNYFKDLKIRFAQQIIPVSQENMFEYSIQIPKLQKPIEIQIQQPVNTPPPFTSTQNEPQFPKIENVPQPPKIPNTLEPTNILNTLELPSLQNLPQPQFKFEFHAKQHPYQWQIQPENNPFEFGMNPQGPIMQIPPHKYEIEYVVHSQTEKQPLPVNTPHVFNIGKDHLLNFINNKNPELLNLIPQKENVQDIIKIIMMNNSVIQVEGDKHNNLNMDPLVKDLWKKFIKVLWEKKGDVTDLPEELRDYFYDLVNNPESQTYLDVIFNSFKINPEIITAWINFFKELKDNKVTINDMPDQLVSFITTYDSPQDFLRVVLKMKNISDDSDFLNIHVEPNIINLWKQCTESVAKNKGNIKNIPKELLDFFYSASENHVYKKYLKMIFDSDVINPEILIIWNKYITDLKNHRADLEDMPSELKQLMMKYDNPDDFLKVVVPSNPDDISVDKAAIQKWQDFLNNFQIVTVPIKKPDPEEKFRITPDLLDQWNKFLNDLKNHETTLDKLPIEIRNFLTLFQKPQDLIKQIFRANNITYDINLLNNPVDKNVQDQWDVLINSLKSPNEHIKFIPHDLLNYLYGLSPSIDYKTSIDTLFQIDYNLLQKLKQFIEEFNHNPLTINDIPEDIKYFMTKFDHPQDFIRSVITPLNIPINENMAHDLINPKIILLWQQFVNQLNEPQVTEVQIPSDLFEYIVQLSTSPEYKLILKNIFDTNKQNIIIKQLDQKWNNLKISRPGYDNSFTGLISTIRDFVSTTDCNENIVITKLFKEVFDNLSKCKL